MKSAKQWLGELEARHWPLRPTRVIRRDIEEIQADAYAAGALAYQQSLILKLRDGSLGAGFEELAKLSKKPTLKPEP